MKRIRRMLIILGLLINLFYMAVPCMASSASSAYEKYVQENMIPALGKASNGTEISSGSFGWCSKTGVFSTYIEDFNADGKDKAVVVYLKKDSTVGMPFSYTDVNLAVLSIKNGKVSKIQDIAVAGIDGYLGVDFRIYVKTYSGKKYIVIQRIETIDNPSSDIFVLSMDKSGEFSGTGFCGETFEGRCWVQLSSVDFSSFEDSLLSFDYNSGTSLLETEGDLTNAEYGQLLQAGLEKYGLGLELSNVSYGGEMWNLKQDSDMTLIGSIKTTSYDYVQDRRITVYQSEGNFQNDSSPSDEETDALHDPQGYIIPESDQRYLTEADVEGLSLQEINYAKNEIFARKGRKFLSVELQNYFNSKTWYEGLYEPGDFDANYEAVLISDCEKANADFLAGIEHSIDAGGYQLDSGIGGQ